MRNEAHRNTVVLFEINLKPKLNASNAVYKVHSQLLEDNNCKINENAFAIYSTIHFDCFYPAEGNAGMQSQPNIKAIEKPSFRKLGCFATKIRNQSQQQFRFCSFKRTIKSNEWMRKPWDLFEIFAQMFSKSCPW